MLSALQIILNTLRIGTSKVPIVGFAKGGPLEKYHFDIQFEDRNHGKNNTVFLEPKAFNLCAHEAGAVEEEKTKFTELLAEEKNTNPNAATYTIKLNDKSIGLIRSFKLFE